ncbi:MAG: cupin domain-containing protein [Geitlerinemataceae cyanobacterium]
MFDPIAQLQLEPHPEGGYFRETYRASETIAREALPERFRGDRAHSTAIYFFLPQGQTSSLHRIAADEVWHFYAGAPLTIVEVSPEFGARETVLGIDLAAGQRPQYVVSAGTWFGAIADRGDTLVGCTVAPGFDFADFELGDRATLRALVAAHSEAQVTVDRLTPA